MSSRTPERGASCNYKWSIGNRVIFTCNSGHRCVQGSARRSERIQDRGVDKKGKNTDILQRCLVICITYSIIGNI